MNLTFNEAKHLLLRTGFGGTATEILSLVGLTKQAAVHKIIERVDTFAQTSPPVWVHDSPPTRRQRKSMSKVERKEFRKTTKQKAFKLKSWWFQQCINSSSPFSERMTLFWHNHFTSSLQKVRWPPYMYQQNALLRRYALGNFRELLHKIVKDPAMIIYLDNISNRKNKPNENFARELLELFTLGEGHYSEQDIKQAAKAFTGWKINRSTAQFRFAPKQHDFGYKRFLGRSGEFSGEQIIDIILDHPQTSLHITEKLWREYVSLKPDPKEIQRLARIFRANNYELKELLQGLLTSKQFWEKSNRAGLIKSPVELIVGTLRVLQIHVHDLDPIVRLSRRLGQDILNPPNVKGWPGGTAWISTDTFLLRQSFTSQIMRGMDAHHDTNMMTEKPKNNKNSISLSVDDDFIAKLTAGNSTSDVITNVVLALNPVNPLPNNKDLYTFVFNIIQDPVYQLK